MVARAAVLEPLRHLELAGGARLLALPRHRHLEAGVVDGDAALAADVGGEVEREAVGVVQLEGDVAVEDALAPAAGSAAIAASRISMPLAMVWKKRSSSWRSTSVTRCCSRRSSG